MNPLTSEWVQKAEGDFKMDTQSKFATPASLQIKLRQ